LNTKLIVDNTARKYYREISASSRLGCYENYYYENIYVPKYILFQLKQNTWYMIQIALWN